MTITCPRCGFDYNHILGVYKGDEYERLLQRPAGDTDVAIRFGCENGCLWWETNHFHSGILTRRIHIEHFIEVTQFIEVTR